jgi:hypothetical protein
MATAIDKLNALCGAIIELARSLDELGTSPRQPFGKGHKEDLDKRAGKLAEEYSRVSKLKPATLAAKQVGNALHLLEVAQAAFDVVADNVSNNFGASELLKLVDDAISAVAQVK